MKSLFVKWYSLAEKQFLPMKLLLDGAFVKGMEPSQEEDGDLYLSDGFIDAHAHVYDGGTDLGVSADEIGYRTGVHLIIDAGSAGAINYPCFDQYVLPAHQTPVKAFLNIGRAGLVTKNPYCDERVLDIDAALRCMHEDKGKRIIGIKVLSSGLIVEKAGVKPIRMAAEAAEKAGLPLMAHLVEGPPANEETMPLMRKGDIITHCFHGAPNLEANRKAARGVALHTEYASIKNVMWNSDGTPTKPLEEALQRGVYLDVGHGAGSFDQFVAGAAIRAGVRNFSISSDAHIRNVKGVVKNLPHVMSKFLSLGMSLAEVVESVTEIPARQLGLSGWCGNPLKCATLFRVRARTENDPEFLDSNQIPMQVDRVIDPVAVIRSGRYEPVNSFEVK